jgi:hypothetical protein
MGWNTTLNALEVWTGAIWQTVVYGSFATEMFLWGGGGAGGRRQFQPQVISITKPF